MPSIKNKFLFIGIIFFCVLALLFAYFTEYVLEHLPCNLCLIERIPYAVTIFLAFLVLFFKKYEKIILFGIGSFFIIGTIISFYHFGIEQEFFTESSVCDFGNSKTLSAQDLLKELKVKSVSCKDVTFRVFGLSLATFNTITSLTISTIMLRAGINYDKN